MALATTREHKMRSFLTVLGVIIGTGAVIGVGSIIAGLDGAITNLLRSLGPNTIIVTEEQGDGQLDARGDAPQAADARKRARHRGALPLRAVRQPLHFSHDTACISARYKGNDLYNIDLGGTEEGYAAGGTTMKSGRFFSDFENSHHVPVVVIGEDV